jgi:hypothetical protein
MAFSEELQSIPSLLDEIESLKERIKKLEEENIGTSNCLYEIMNSLEQLTRESRDFHP